MIATIAPTTSRQAFVHLIRRVLTPNQSYPIASIHLATVDVDGPGLRGAAYHGDSQPHGSKLRQGEADGAGKGAYPR